MKVAPAIFQQEVNTMLSGLDFAVAYLDDSLLKGENPEEQEKNVFEIFGRIQDYGFNLK